ncbi:MAG: lysophospholipid acyltransferase family protein [Planctomycetota bacterium]
MWSFFVYWSVRLVAHFFSVLPLRVALWIARVCGLVCHYVLRFRGRVVANNLRYVLGGELPARELRAIDREAYQQLAMHIVELLRYSVGKPDSAMHQIDTAPLEELARRNRAGQPAIVCSPHHGNFELIGIALNSLGVEQHVVMKRIKSVAFQRLIVETRERLGMRLVMKGLEAVGELRAALNAGKIVCMLPDQNARSHGAVVDFLGKPASTFRGPAVLHLLTGAPIVVVAVERRRDDPTRHLIHVAWIESTPRREKRTDDIVAITQQICDAMRAPILKNPGEYFWFHRRWGKQLPQSTNASESAVRVEPIQTP